MKKELDQYKGSHGEFYKPPNSSRGYLTMTTLSCLCGRPWDEISLAFVSAFRPSLIRVTQGEITTSFFTGRITVFLDENGLISKIQQEVSVWLPDSIPHGAALKESLKQQESER